MILTNVDNSAEVEQIGIQNNECNVAICANVAGIQAQTGVLAAVVNVLTSQEDVDNSAEVEQISIQDNDCNIAICANTAVAQAQTGVAAVVANIGNSFDDVTNSAEVEQGNRITIVMFQLVQT